MIHWEIPSVALAIGRNLYVVATTIAQPKLYYSCSTSGLEQTAGWEESKKEGRSVKSVVATVRPIHHTPHT